MEVDCSRSKKLRSGEWGFDQELQRKFLSVILACVLIWYTVVTMPGAASPRTRRPQEAGEGEAREADNSSGPLIALIPATGARPRSSLEGRATTATELEWPDIIDC
jgi:hypothetical protein